MAKQRTQHEEMIYSLKRIFSNMAKPKSSDFGMLIDIADNDPIFRYHKVEGGGKKGMGSMKENT